MEEFFRDLTVRYPRLTQFGAAAGPVILEGARVGRLIADSFDYPPHLVQAVPPLAGGPQANDKLAIWLYRVRENQFAIANTIPSLPTVVLFASGQMPYYASPRFDVARWNYSNYASALLGPGAA